MKLKNIALIISNNSILHEALPEMTLIQSESELEHYNKIDLLIVDMILSPSAIKRIITVSDRIINLSSAAIENSITLQPPFRLHTLVEIIQTVKQNEEIFCLINNKILYSQKAGYINYADEQITLSDKENELFSALLSEPNYSLTKEEILTKIWFYAKNAETSTIDIHLSRLRSRLPEGLLNIKDSSASLKVLDLK